MTGRQDTLLCLEPVLHIMAALAATLPVQSKDQDSNARAEGLRHISIQQSSNYRFGDRLILLWRDGAGFTSRL